MIPQIGKFSLTSNISGDTLKSNLLGSRIFRFMDWNEPSTPHWCRIRYMEKVSYYKNEFSQNPINCKVSLAERLNGCRQYRTASWIYESMTVVNIIWFASS